jgi:hypothetical protein
VNEPFAINWNETHRTPTQRKASLGDPQRFNTDANNAIVYAHDALVDGLGKIEGLVRDPTRTEVSKHAAARAVAKKTIGVIQTSASSIKALGASLNRRAQEMVEEQFAVDPNRASIQSEVRGWIRETAKAEGGLSVIRKAMGESAEVAAVLFHSPNFLLGLAVEVQANLVADGIEKYAPKAFAMIAEADALSALAIKYEHVARAVDQSFYSSALADQAALRVEVD